MAGLAQRQCRQLHDHQDARPDAIQDLDGARARAQILPREPISERKIATLKDGGLMSSLLPRDCGHRGPDLGQVGGRGFILPNDRVDVIATLG